MEKRCQGGRSIFDKPGFEKDLVLPLRLVDEVLIVDYGKDRLAEFESIVKEYGKVEAQKYWNHFHMKVRSEDLVIQRQLAYELLDSFRKKAKELCDKCVLIGEIKDDGFEIEITFWTYVKE